jgi:hypothetical protein
MVSRQERRERDGVRLDEDVAHERQRQQDHVPDAHDGVGRAQDQAERCPRPREREGEREHEDDRGEDSERAAAGAEAMTDRARAGLPPTS